jgi:hypothetical protein
LRLLAVREHAQRRPSAAFALIVAAYERSPASPDALADIAGMLAGFGYANEALAILDDMARRHVVPSPPMGIAGTDGLAYLRAYCLVRLGDIAAAKPLLRGVAARQPQLAEASRLLAVISGDAEEQRKYLLLGVWRHRPPLMSSVETDLDKAEPDPLKEGEQVCADLRTILDLSRGEVGVLPNVIYAGSVTRANALVPAMETAIAASDRRFWELLAQRKEPPGFKHTDDDVQETWGHRTAGILRSLDYRDRKLRDLERARRQVEQERIAGLREVEAERTKAVEEAQEKFIRARVPQNAPPTLEQINEIARPFHTAALGRARRFVQRQEEAERRLFAEWHLLATSLSGQVGDPAWHEYYRLSIEAQRCQAYTRLLQLARTQAEIGAHPGITREEGEVPMAPTPQKVAKCDGNSPMKFGTGNLPGGGSLPFQVGVTLGCGGLALELGVDTEIPGVSINSELGLDSKGEFTAFVGPKAEFGVGNENIAALSASAKAGVYVTANRDGVSDAGVKYTSGVSGNVGSDSRSRTVAEGSVSLYPAVAPASSGIEGLAIYR